MIRRVWSKDDPYCGRLEMFCDGTVFQCGVADGDKLFTLDRDEAEELITFLIEEARKIKEPAIQDCQVP